MNTTMTLTNEKKIVAGVREQIYEMAREANGRRIKQGGREMKTKARAKMMDEAFIHRNNNHDDPQVEEGYQNLLRLAPELTDDELRTEVDFFTGAEDHGDIY